MGRTTLAQYCVDIAFGLSQGVCRIVQEPTGYLLGMRIRRRVRILGFSVEHPGGRDGSQHGDVIFSLQVSTKCMVERGL